MKYMLMIHQGATPTPLDPEAWATLSEGEQQAIYAAYKAINEMPGVTPGNGLQAPETATRSRCRAARRSRLTVRSSRPRKRSTATSSMRPTTSTQRSSSRRGSRQHVSAARSRCVRSWSGSRPFARRGGRHGCCADRLRRRLRPRRGSRAEGPRDRRGALAAVISIDDSIRLEAIAGAISKRRT